MSSRPTRRGPGAIQLVRRRVNAARAERRRQSPRTSEEVAQYGNAVGDVELAVVVGVGSIETGGRRALCEEVHEGEYCVGVGGILMRGRGAVAFCFASPSGTITDSFGGKRNRFTASSAAGRPPGATRRRHADEEPTRHEPRSAAKLAARGQQESCGMRDRFSASLAAGRPPGAQRRLHTGKTSPRSSPCREARSTRTGFGEPCPPPYSCAAKPRNGELP